jgi:hypothetical protein
MSEESDKLAEESRQTKEALAAVREELSAVSAELDRLTGGTFSMDTSFRKMRSSSDDITGAFVRGRTSADGLHRSFGNLNEAQKALIKSMEDEIKSRALAKQSLNELTNAAGQFTKSLLTAGGGLSKYNGAIDKAGDAAFNFGKSLGPIGVVLGGVVKGATMLASAIMKQNDAMMAAKDALADFGAAGTLTTTSIRDMAAGAGYTREELAKWSKVTKSLGTDIISLSGTVNGGVQEFANLTKVTNAQYETYRKMGISQEQLTQNQADYVRLQAASGKIITEQMKRDGSLKQASLEYTENLLQLSAITGESVEGAKKLKEQAAANFDIMIKTRQQLLEANELRKTGNADDKLKADSIDKEIANREKLLAIVASTGDKELLAATQSKLATGAWTETSKKLLLTIPGFQNLENSLKEGNDVSGEFADSLRDGINANVKNLGTAGMFDKTMGNMFGMSEQLLQWSGKRTEQDIATEKAKSDAAIKAAAENKGPTDNVAAAVAKEETFSREARKILDDAILALNPFAENTKLASAASIALAGAAVAAAGALTKITAGKIGDVLGGLPGGGTTGEVAGATKAAGKFGKFATGASKAIKIGGAATALAAGAYEGYQGYSAAEDEVKAGKITKTQGTVKKSEAVGEGAGSAVGGTAGAILGGTLGSVVPVLGTAIGAAVGGYLGSQAGGWLGKMGGGLVGNNLAKSTIAEEKKKKADAEYIDAKEQATKAEKESSATLEKAIGPLKKFTGEIDDATRALVKDEIEIIAPGPGPKVSKPYVGTSTAGAGRGAIAPGTEMKPEDASSVSEAKQLGSTTPKYIPETEQPTPPAVAAGAPVRPIKKQETEQPTPPAVAAGAPVRPIKKQEAPPPVPPATAAGAASTGKFKGFGKDVDTDIADAAKKYNMDEKTLRGFVKMEAGWTGKMSPTGAIGTGQFIQSTWDSLAKSKEGQELGMRKIGNDFRTANDPRFDKRTNTMATALLAKKNSEILEKAGLPVTGENLYMLHNIGPGVIPALKGQPVSEATLLAMKQNGMKPGQTGADFAKMQKEKFNTQASIANDSDSSSQPERVASIKRQQPPQAREGGIFSGSKNGFPVELHGNELVAPLDPTSIIAKLLMAPSSESMPKIAEATKAEPVAPVEAPNTGLTVDMIEMLAGKLDAMISKLSDSHDTQEKLLQYSRV